MDVVYSISSPRELFPVGAFAMVKPPLLAASTSTCEIPGPVSLAVDPAAAAVPAAPAAPAAPATPAAPAAPAAAPFPAALRNNRVKIRVKIAVRRYLPLAFGALRSSSCFSRGFGGCACLQVLSGRGCLRLRLAGARATGGQVEALVNVRLEIPCAGFLASCHPCMALDAAVDVLL